MPNTLDYAMSVTGNNTEYKTYIGDMWLTSMTSAKPPQLSTSVGMSEIWILLLLVFQTG